jgi:hypothetical protein
MVMTTIIVMVGWIFLSTGLLLVFEFLMREADRRDMTRWCLCRCKQWRIPPGKRDIWSYPRASEPGDRPVRHARDRCTEWDGVSHVGD